MSGGINIFLLYDFMTLTETTLPFYQFQCGSRRIEKALPRPQEANTSQTDVHTACVGCDVTLLP